MIKKIRRSGGTLPLGCVASEPVPEFVIQGTMSSGSPTPSSLKQGFISTERYVLHSLSVHGIRAHGKSFDE